MARCYHCMKEYTEEANFCPHCGYDRHAKAHDLYYMEPGTLLSDGRYMIGESVNAGGFGIVYKAWDNTFAKMVAIKEYYPGSIVTRTPGTLEVRSYSEKNIEEFEKGKKRFLNSQPQPLLYVASPSLTLVAFYLIFPLKFGIHLRVNLIYQPFEKNQLSIYHFRLSHFDEIEAILL